MSKTVLQLKLILVLVIMGVTLILTTVELFPIGSDVLTLPAPDLTGHIPLSSAIQDSTITRNLKNRSISIKEISQLLWSFQGITHGSGFRSAPSAGATYPLKIFFLQRSPSLLKEGYYSYNSDQHWLKAISDGVNDTELLLTLTSEDREPFSNVSTVFFILADYERTTDRYGKRGVQYVHLEVGHALQNFLLQSSALNLDTWVITQFDSEQIKQTLNITLEPLIILPVGQHDDLSHVLLRIKKQNSRIEESQKEMTVEQAIANRKSIRDYIGGKIPLAVLMDILQDSITINYLEGDNSLLDLRVVAGEIDGLSTGMYQFSMDNYALNQYSQEDSRNSLKAVALDQPWVENAQLDLVLSANTTWIDQQSDPIFYQRKMMFNIGMIAQNIYLKCTSHGLGTVVVGAFNDWGVAQLIAIPDTHMPFYIIPIGLTPEFGEHPSIFNLPMTEIARSIGLLSFILFYFSLYMTLPVLRRRNRKQTRWLHFISGSIFITGIGYHYMTIHGHVKSFSAFFNVYVYFNALLGFIGDIFTFPTTRFELGKFAINYGLIFGSIAAVSGIIMFFRRVKYQKLLRSLHKYTLFLVLLLAIVHNFFNGTYFAWQPFFFLYLNILIFSFYFLINYSFDLIRLSRRQTKQLQ